MKVNMVIIGNLISYGNITGGGIRQCKESEIGTKYDISNAIIIKGDVVVQSFDNYSNIVIVCGCISAKETGGQHVAQ